MRGSRPCRLLVGLSTADHSPSGFAWVRSWVVGFVGLQGNAEERVERWRVLHSQYIEETEAKLAKLRTTVAAC